MQPNPRHHTPLALPALLAVLAAVVLSGCGTSTSSRAGSSSTSTSSTSSSSTSSSTSSTTAPCTFAGTTAPSAQAASGPYLLTDVQVVAGACTDTITFTFRTATPGGPPPYAIERVSPPFAQAGSGEAIAVPGSTFLKVRFQPSWIVDIDDANATPTYTGPRRIEPAGTVVTRGVVLFDASEAVVGWIVGLDGSGGYTVTSSASPPSVTITVGR